MPKPGEYGGGVEGAERDVKKSKYYFGDLFKAGRYIPKHPELFGPPRWHEWLHPEFVKAHTDYLAASRLQAGPARLEAMQSAWKSCLTLETDGGGPGVYSFPCFTQDFCRVLLDEVDHAQDCYGKLLKRPNGMNRYGMVLNQVGLEPAITALQQSYIKDLQGFLFGREGADPDDHHCFVVRYNKDEDVGLDMHTDSSDITLNVCLGRDFAGATLTFCGVKGNHDHRNLKHVYRHQIGRGVIHLGRQRHGADDLYSGERLNFILWNNSSSWRSSAAHIELMENMRNMETTPDLICLSYTHDADYTKYKSRLSDSEAVKRGVMLDRVQSDPKRRALCRS